MSYSSPKIVTLSAALQMIRQGRCKSWFQIDYFLFAQFNATAAAYEADE